MKRRREFEKLFGIEHPIIQGPFGGGFSTARLAASVSNRGGLGSFGAHHLAPEEITRIVAEIRRQTPKPFAINLWVSNHDPGGGVPDPAAKEQLQRTLLPYYVDLELEPVMPPNKPIYNFEDQARAAIEAGAPVFSFVFGVPSPDIRRLAKQRGVLLVGAATTAQEARVMEQANVDAIVATGMEAGGHRPSFLASAEDSLTGTLALVPVAASTVEIPVIAAGGIADARGVTAALELGAQAVQVGTAFLACEESAAPDLHRNLLFDQRAERTVLTRVFSGRLARGIRNRLHDELAKQKLLPYPAQGWLVGALREAAIAQGKADLLSLWSGQSARLLRHRRASDVLDSLVAGTN